MSPSFNLLVFGYIRMYSSSSSSTKHSPIPLPIQHLILAFYPKLSYYDGIFLQQNIGEILHLESERKILMKGYINSGVLSVGIPVDEMVSYYWQIRIDSKSKANEYHFIGVVSNVHRSKLPTSSALRLIREREREREFDSCVRVCFVC